jgi:hypothetical protein
LGHSLCLSHCCFNVHLFSCVNKPPPLLQPLQAFIDKTGFWLEVEVLAKLLEPLALAVMAIQQRTSNLADVLHYHIMIAHVLTSATYMDTSFKQHCIDAFNFRWGQVRSRRGVQCHVKWLRYQCLVMSRKDIL